jgi:glycosyltransferase involved in cell wall biosynthesis
VQGLCTKSINAAIFAYPSLADSQPQVVTEAIAFGLPLVASNIEPIADLIDLNTGAGIQVDPTDTSGFAAAIIELMQNKPRRQSMSEEASRLASGFSWKRTAEETLTLYRRLASNRSNNNPKMSDSR